METEAKVADQKGEQIVLNEYSVYDYLKKTPSVLIAVLSSIVAIVTYLSKALAILSTQKQLAFWGIDSAFASSGGDSLIFRATASVLYSLGILLMSLLFSATYDAYVPFKRCGLVFRYLAKNKKEEVKKLKQEANHGNQSSKNEEYIKTVKILQGATKEYVRGARYQLLKNITPIAFILCIVYLAYFGVSSTDGLNKTWLTAIVCVIIQIVTFLVLARIAASKAIDKKHLKQNCKDIELLEKVKPNFSTDIFPLGKLFSKGLRAVLKNTTIVIIVVALFMNCCLVAVVHAVVPAKPLLTNTEMRIVRLDDTDYALVYQIGDKYFLEAAELREEQGEDGIEYVLTVYKDQQRILSINDISFVTYEFREIIPTLSN